MGCRSLSGKELQPAWALGNSATLSRFPRAAICAYAASSPPSRKP